MKKSTLLVALCTVVLAAGLMVGCSSSTSSSSQKQATTDLSGKTISIYCGAGMTNPFQEIADAFKAETNCEVNVTFANAGQIQSQINTTQEGDMFIAGSADELQPVADSVESQKDLVKHIPVLATASGNPKGITGLSSLTDEGVTFIMGDPESTPIGKIAKKALTDAGIFDQVNIIATTTTAPQLATALNSGEADATIVWKENVSDSSQLVQTTDLDKYVKTVPAATLTCAQDTDAVAAFNEYLDSDEAHAIWEKYGYVVL